MVKSLTKNEYLVFIYKVLRTLAISAEIKMVYGYYFSGTSGYDEDEKLLKRQSFIKNFVQDLVETHLINKKIKVFRINQLWQKKPHDLFKVKNIRLA